LTHLSDWTLWAYGLMFMCTAMPNCMLILVCLSPHSSRSIPN
jgi:hypothetical protein